MNTINWRLLLVHFLATIILIAAARELIFYFTLEDFRAFQDAMKESNNSPLIATGTGKYRTMTIGELAYKPLYYPIYASLTTLLISFSISLTYALKRNISWMNSILVLIAGFLFFRIGIYKTEIGSTIFYSFGHLFKHLGETFYYLSNFAILLVIGLTLFFSPWTRNLIQSEQRPTPGNEEGE
ncbi:MAG: hypothetical protein CFE21_09300 [Bacteroidetes bacterium B1(2017)]|nr:MAG: hypothetical protein CFE21_09300 [Bacteroidetes bacterium B1(2017)]